MPLSGHHPAAHSAASEPNRSPGPKQTVHQKCHICCAAAVTLDKATVSAKRTIITDDTNVHSETKDEHVITPLSLVAVGAWTNYTWCAR
jgi:hypothetical protein